MEYLRYDQQRVLVLAPHADDETLGCGGVIGKYARAGSPVRVVVASFVLGTTKRYDKQRNAYRDYRGDARLQEMHRAMEILGVAESRILFTEHADRVRYHGRLDERPRQELVEQVERQIADFSPTVLYLPSITKHQDHEAFHLAALAAIRPYYWNGSALVYETDGELQFQPNVFAVLDDADMKRKEEALIAYRTQTEARPHPVNPESVRDRAKFRGSQIYATYAEAFQAIRIYG